MIRVVIESLVLFFAPTLVYLTYTWLTREENASGERVLSEAPLVWLAAAGAMLVVITMVLFGSTVGGRPDQGYEPPGVKNGKIIPGHQQ